MLIDRQLTGAGWSVQSRPNILFAAQGVAVREVIMAPGHGRADYVLAVGLGDRGRSASRRNGSTRSTAISSSHASRETSLEDLDSLPAPEVIARQIVVDDLTAALAEFEAVAVALEGAAGPLPDVGTP
ncbi:hypothetical protein SAMN05661080_03298 [Modestobacter sp. DSM 44400]|uniref:hypothetical protein n=1 Tax=Modestobacter sp. DSM 44400 TaxID=1550230 RepID=UPI0008996FF7|nr:hypothetical protein [Modestobacter sp. DSM 44400]SDY38378.1 hypothetical protein SAMN05661080_03298 [Modestobacter sp. DSM 44400]